MTPLERLTAANRVIGIVMQLQHVVSYIQAHVTTLDRPTETYLTAYMITVIQYAQKTLEILKTDDVAPLLGKRCMFY